MEYDSRPGRMVIRRVEGSTTYDRESESDPEKGDKENCEKEMKGRDKKLMDDIKSRFMERNNGNMELAVKDINEAASKTEDPLVVIALYLARNQILASTKNE